MTADEHYKLMFGDLALRCALLLAENDALRERLAQADPAAKGVTRDRRRSKGRGAAADRGAVDAHRQHVGTNGTAAAAHAG